MGSPPSFWGLPPSFWGLPPPADPRAFYVISSWEQGAQIYELGAASVAERKA